MVSQILCFIFFVGECNMLIVSLSFLLIGIHCLRTRAYGIDKPEFSVNKKKYVVIFDVCCDIDFFCFPLQRTGIFSSREEKREWAGWGLRGRVWGGATAKETNFYTLKFTLRCELWLNRKLGPLSVRQETQVKV
jgi:hypothetical protein